MSTSWKDVPLPAPRYQGELVAERLLDGSGFHIRSRTWHLAGEVECEGPTAVHTLLLSLGPRPRPAEVCFEGRGRVAGLLRPGQVSLFPAHLPFSGHSIGVGTESQLVLTLDPAMVAQACGEELDPAGVEPVPSLDLQNATVSQAMVALHREAEHPDLMSRLYVESLTLVVITELVRHHSGRGTWLAGGRSLTPRRLRRIMDYVEAHLADDLSIVRLAAIAGMSPIHFKRQFKSLTGLSPHQYVLRRRVERAMILLARADTCIVDVALAVGFSSQSHLTAALRRFSGATPRAYRLKLGA